MSAFKRVILLWHIAFFPGHNEKDYYSKFSNWFVINGIYKIHSLFKDVAYENKKRML